MPVNGEKHGQLVMTRRHLANVLNFAWFQLIWFTAVLGGNAVEAVLAVAIALHIWLAPRRTHELLLVSAVALLGASVDSLLAVAGLFVFDSAGPLPIPLWHVAIWIGFAGTLRHSMRFMVDQPRLLLIAAAVFAPLSYVAAERLGAVVFPLGELFTAAVVGMVWVLLVPVLIALVNFFEKNMPKLPAQDKFVKEV